MYFKKQQQLKLSIILLIAPILMASCSWFNKEKSSEGNSITVERTFNCLGEISKKVDLYFSSQLSEEESRKYITCWKNSFIQFLKHVEGDSSDSYTPLEVKNFLETYFVKSKIDSDEELISTSMLEVTMQFKKAFFGGSPFNITKSELKLFIQFLEEFKNFVVAFKPYAKLFTFSETRWTELPTIGLKISNGIRVLKRFQGSLLSLSKGSKEGYSLQSFKRLILEYHFFFNRVRSQKFESRVDNSIEFFQEFKKTFVSGPLERVLHQEWKDLLSAMIGTYESALRYHYIIKEDPSRSFYGSGLKNMNIIFKNSYNMVMRSLELQDLNVISFDQLYRLVNKYHTLTGELPFNVRVSTVFPLFKKLLKKAFGSIFELPKRRNLPGVNFLVLNGIKKEYDIWYNVQKELHLLFKNDLDIKKKESFRGALLGYSFSNKDTENAIVRIKKGRPLIFKGCSEKNLKRCEGIYISQNVNKTWSNIKYKVDNLSYMNFYRLLVRLLIRAYAENTPRALKLRGLKSQELQNFYLDFRKLGIELKSVNPYSFNSGQRAFLEGSLFVFSSRGIQVRRKNCEDVELPPEGEGRPNSEEKTCKSVDSSQSLISFEELMQLTAYSYSSNFKGKKLFNRFREKCGLDNDHKGVFGQGSISREECFNIYLGEIIIEEFQNLESLNNYLKNIPFFVMQDFMDLLVDVVSQKENSNKHIEMSEFVTIAGLLQYIETLMVQFDLNQDRKLSGFEIKTFYKRLATFLEETLQEHSMSNESRESAFYYMLKNREKPNIMEIWLWDTKSYNIFSKHFWTKENWISDRPDTYKIKLSYYQLMRSFVGIIRQLSHQDQGGSEPEVEKKKREYLERQVEGEFLIPEGA